MCNSRFLPFAAALLVGLAFASTGRLIAQSWTDEAGRDPWNDFSPEDVGLIANWPPAGRIKLKLEPSVRDKLLEAVRSSEIDPVLRDKFLDVLRSSEILQEVRPQLVAPSEAPAPSSAGPFFVGIAVGMVLWALLTLVALRWTRRVRPG